MNNELTEKTRFKKENSGSSAVPPEGKSRLYTEPSLLIITILGIVSFALLFYSGEGWHSRSLLLSSLTSDTNALRDRLFEASAFSNRFPPNHPGVPLRPLIRKLSDARIHLVDIVDKSRQCGLKEDSALARTSRDLLHNINEFTANLKKMNQSSQSLVFTDSERLMIIATLGKLLTSTNDLHKETAVFVNNQTVRQQIMHRAGLFVWLIALLAALGVIHFSERKRRQQQNRLAAEERKWRSAIENSPDAIALVDLSGRVVYLSHPALGLTPADAVGRFLWDACRKDSDNPPCEANLRQALTRARDTGEPASVEVQPTTSDEEDWCLVRFGVVIDGDNPLIPVICTKTTQQHQAARALQESEFRFRRLSEAAFEGVIIHENGITIDVNDALCKMLGYTREELIGIDAHKLVVSDDHETIDRMIGERSEQPYDIRALRKDGTTFPVELRARHTRLDGKDVRIVAVHDISRRLAAENSLRASEEKFRKLATSRKLLIDELNHRVKNNLSGLLSLVSLVGSNARSVDDFAERITGKLRAMAVAHQLMAGRDWEDVDFENMVRRLLDQLLHDELSSCSVKVQGPRVSLAPRQASPMAMIIQELITNWRKHGVDSSPASCARLSWSIKSDQKDRILRLVWQEYESGKEIVDSNGEQNTAPDAELPREEWGMGLNLIDGFARFELAGGVRYLKTPDGFRCELECLLETPDAQTLVTHAS